MAQTQDPATKAFSLSKQASLWYGLEPSTKQTTNNPRWLGKMGLYLSMATPHTAKRHAVPAKLFEIWEQGSGTLRQEDEERKQQKDKNAVLGWCNYTDYRVSGLN
jgi:hypothetical protein